MDESEEKKTHWNSFVGDKLWIYWSFSTLGQLLLARFRCSEMAMLVLALMKSDSTDVPLPSRLQRCRYQSTSHSGCDHRYITSITVDFIRFRANHVFRLANDVRKKSNARSFYFGLTIECMPLRARAKAAFKLESPQKITNWNMFRVKNQRKHIR